MTDANPGESSDLVALLAQIAKKDRSAFLKLHEATAAQTHSIATTLLRSKQDAEEVSGDVYLYVWIHASRFSPERGSVRTWLRVVTRSRSIDLIRRRVSGLSDEKTSREFSENAICMEPRPDDIVALSQEHDAVQRALESLPKQRREMIELAYLHGLTHRQIALATKSPLGTVKSHVRRSLCHLQAVVAAQLFL